LQFLRGIRRCRRRMGWSTNSALQQPCQYINSVIASQTGLGNLLAPDMLLYTGKQSCAPFPELLPASPFP